MREKNLYAELRELRQLIESLSRQFYESLTTAPLHHEWYTLDEACEIKGTSAKTAKNQPWLQPKGGEPDAVVGKKKRWHRETIRQWLDQTDEELSP